MPIAMSQEYYKNIGTRQLAINIFSPEEARHAHTGIVMLHGGSWQVGDPSMMNEYVPDLTAQGFTVFTPEYRLLGEAAWPAQLEDVKSAIRWIRVRARQWNIHPDKIVVQGFSAGAHLALMAGATPDDPAYKDDTFSGVSDAVNGIVSFFAPVEFTTDTPEPGIHPAHVLLEKGSSRAQAHGISPLKLVNGNFPPTFLIHGTADTMVPYVASLRMAMALGKHGVDVELHLYPRQDHEFARLPSLKPMVLLEVCHFLHRMVVQPEAYDRESLTMNPFASRSNNPVKHSHLQH